MSKISTINHRKLIVIYHKIKGMINCSLFPLNDSLSSAVELKHEVLLCNRHDGWSWWS